jgi:Tfp pilus assembly protein PilO
MFNLPTISLPAFPKIGSGEETSKILKLAAPVGALVVAVLVFIFVVLPTFNKVIGITVSNRQLSARVGSLETKASALQSLDKNKLDLQLSASEQLLPSDKGVFTIVGQIEREASNSGVILNKVDVAPGSIGDSSGDKSLTSGQGQGQTSSAPAAGDLGGVNVDTPLVQLKVSFTGDYRGFLNFIKAIASLPRVVSIHDLTIVTGGAEASSVIHIQMTVDAYWKPLPSELPPVESPIEQLTDSESKILDNVKFEQTTAPIVNGGVANPTVPTGRSDIFAPF